MKVFVTLATGKVAKHKGRALAIRLPKDERKGCLVVASLHGRILKTLKTYEPGEWTNAVLRRDAKRKEPVEVPTEPLPVPGLHVSHLVH